MDELPNPTPQGRQGRRPPVPRWVIGFLVVAALLLLAALVSLVLGVQHGPGMHSLGEPATTSSVNASEPA